MATNYDVDYNDERFDKVESAKSDALDQVDETYGDMIAKSDDYFNKQIDATEKWEKEQTKLQNEKTDFAIEQINQQKDQAEKDYTKEQSGAYVDWQKQSNQYGANAEKVAAGGLAGSGFSESSQVSMYNTYQNRVATAREAYSRAVLNYDNAIKDAQLQNNSILAEIAYESLQKQLELGLQGFQYKNTLITEKANKRLEVERDYYNRYQDVLQQINTENALAEEVRQYNESIALDREKLAEEKRQFSLSLAEEKRQFNRLHRDSSGGNSGGNSGGKTSNKTGQIVKGNNKNTNVSQVQKDLSSGSDTKLTYSDVATTAAALRKKGAEGWEINQYLNEALNSKNYVPTTSVEWDLKELRSGYVGAR